VRQPYDFLCHILKVANAERIQNLVLSIHF
jgi:hypothetical protein